MEGQNQGGGEVRRLHIIYFLCRKGRIEHPHLIRVHHFSRNGIRLKDVKRWLGELRGKDMPESFAWSYKRKYKSGYVWQDLLDEDLITPISDNEYVLKGSEISSIIPIKDVSFGEKGVTATTMQKEQTKQEDQNPMDSSKKTPSEIEEESQNIASETSTITTDNSPKFQEEEEEKVNNFDNSFSSNSSSSISSFGSMKTKKKIDQDHHHVIEHGENNSADKNSSKNPKFNKSKSYSNGASSIFRNLITCGAVDTNDAGIVPLRKNKTSLSSDKTVSFSSEICKADKIGGSQRIFGTSWNQQTTNGRKSCDGAFGYSKNKSEFGSRRSVSANYKPINGPNCSQCGKPFKPEKLHAHMKSCKGMKALAKGAYSATAAATEKTSKDASKVDSLSAKFLTH
ncbi:protein SOSEKI 1 [Capsicum galapagoense]